MKFFHYNRVSFKYIREANGRFLKKLFQFQIDQSMKKKDLQEAAQLSPISVAKPVKAGKIW